MNYSALNPLEFDVISIQSQVIYGTVGNNAARPTFEHFGLRVCSLPTVLLSNTPLYDTVHGGAIPAEWFAGYLKDLENRRALTAVRAIVLGYLGNSAQADILADWLTNLRKKYPDIEIYIDPVMGDHDSGFYVKSELADNYRQSLCACADIITPNHFELQYLSAQNCDTEERMINAARTLLTGNTHTVIITSAPGKNKQTITNLIVQKDSVQRTQHPYIQSSVKGTGDTFQASLTAALLQGKPIDEATQIAGDFVVEALTYTAEKNSGELCFCPERNKKQP